MARARRQWSGAHLSWRDKRISLCRAAKDDNGEPNRPELQDDDAEGHNGICAGDAFTTERGWEVHTELTQFRWFRNQDVAPRYRERHGKNDAASEQDRGHNSRAVSAPAERVSDVQTATSLPGGHGKRNDAQRYLRAIERDAAGPEDLRACAFCDQIGAAQINPDRERQDQGDHRNAVQLERKFHHSHLITTPRFNAYLSATNAAETCGLAMPDAVVQTSGQRLNMTPETVWACTTVCD
jgi:hypothetical protein